MSNNFQARAKERMVERRKVNKRPFRLGDQLHRVCIIHRTGCRPQKALLPFDPRFKRNPTKRERVRGGFVCICIGNHCGASACRFRDSTPSNRYWFIRIIWKINQIPSALPFVDTSTNKLLFNFTAKTLECFKNDHLLSFIFYLPLN